MAEQNDAPVKYRHQVVEKWVKDFRPTLTDSNIKTMLEEFVIEWGEAKAALICEHCGDPLDGSEPEALDEADGTLAHVECLAQLTDDGDSYGYDRRDDSGYWKED